MNMGPDFWLEHYRSECAQSRTVLQRPPRSRFCRFALVEVDVSLLRQVKGGCDEEKILLAAWPTSSSGSPALRKQKWLTAMRKGHVITASDASIGASMDASTRPNTPRTSQLLSAVTIRLSCLVLTRLPPHQQTASCPLMLLTRKAQDDDHRLPRKSTRQMTH